MDVNAKLQLGTRYHRTGRLKSALAIYEQILNRFPDHPDALHLSGLVAHQGGNSDDAIKRIGRAVSQRPQNRVFRKNLGMVLFAAGNQHMHQGVPELAVDCFLKALEIEPMNANIYHNLGVACQETGHLAKAIVHFRRAVQLNPDLVKLISK